jgi:hypothetical protein
MSMISLTYEDILFLALSIFRHVTHGGVLLLILDIFDNILSFRSRTLFLAVSIYSKDVGSRDDKWHDQTLTCGGDSM